MEAMFQDTDEVTLDPVMVAMFQDTDEVTPVPVMVAMIQDTDCSSWHGNNFPRHRRSHSSS